MRSSRWLVMVVLLAGSCGGKAEPAAPPAAPPGPAAKLPATLQLGERVKSDLDVQKDQAKARRQMFEDTIEGK
jgi:hypothetical protein